MSNLETALDRLARFCVNLEASRVYETEPLHVRRQPLFLNLAARGECSLAPERLLSEIHAVEWDLGRKRGRKYGPRAIDIDILLFGRHSIALPDLTVPHPRLKERRFVLRPLLELEPALADPASGAPYWKSLLTCPPGGVYFHSASRYTVPSLIPLGGDFFFGRNTELWKRRNFT